MNSSSRNPSLASFLLKGEDDFAITYSRDGLHSTLVDESSVISGVAMSINEYSQLRAKRRTQEKHKSKKASKKRKSKKGSRNLSETDSNALDESRSSVASTRTAPVRIKMTGDALLLGCKIDSMGSKLEDIRLLRKEANVEYEEVNALKQRWQDDLSILIDKWEAQLTHILDNKQVHMLQPIRTATSNATCAQ